MQPLLLKLVNLVTSWIPTVESTLLRGRNDYTELSPLNICRRYPGFLLRARSADINISGFTHGGAMYLDDILLS